MNHPNNIISSSNFLLEYLKNQLKDKNKTSEEKYNICLKIWELCGKENKLDQGVYYLLESYSYERTRIDGIYELIKHYCCVGNNETAFSFYLLIQDYYENTVTAIKNLSNSITDFYLPYFMIIVCERIKRFDIGIKMFEIIFQKRHVNVDKWWIGCLFANLNFFIDKTKNPLFFRSCEDYLNILYTHFDGCNFANNNLLLQYVNKYLDKNNISFFAQLKEREKEFIIDRNIQSNKILFYTGFSYYQWNSSFGKDNFLGGSERAVALLSDKFPKNIEIYVSGDVIEEKTGNVEYIHLNRLDEFLQNNQFHTIIISRYVGFFEMYHYFKTKRIFLWAHDTHFLPYNRVNQLDDASIISKRNELIDSCICLTNWQKDSYEKKYPEIKEKIKVIGNGIDFNLFPKDVQLNISTKRIKNRFIYSSNPNRGLKRLLELWYNITHLLPEAELKIVGEKSDDKEIISLMNGFVNIEHLGKRNPTDLYEIMATCDIWFYPVTDFEETFCITALEVMYSNIVSLYYPVAGLKDTISDYGISIEKGNELQVFANLTEEKKDEMRIKARSYAESCSWESRSKIWIDLLELQ